MPGFLTHYIAGKAVFQSLPAEIQQPIKNGERLYNLGTHGPDIFFYYFPGLFRKRTKGVAVEQHVSNLGLFLVEMAKHAKNAAPSDKDVVFAYTAGFLLHYVVDVHAHPYVYAKTLKDDQTMWKNVSDHRRLETAIDVAMLKMISGQKPSGVKQWETINADSQQMSVAAAAYSQALRDVYNRDISPKIVRRAMAYMIRITRLLQSKKGRRKKMFELVESLTVRQPIASAMIHTTELAEDADFLIENHEPWVSPWQEDTFTDSFLDRYKAAVQEGIELVELLYKYVYSELPTEDLSKKVGNRSLKTGLPCEK